MNDHEETDLSRANLETRIPSRDPDDILRHVALAEEHKQALLRRLQPMKAPTAMDLGKESRPDLRVRVDLVVKKFSFETDEQIGEVIPIELIVNWDDGPVAFGAALAEQVGEIAKEVWELNKKLDVEPNTAPHSKHTEE